MRRTASSGLPCGQPARFLESRCPGHDRDPRRRYPRTGTPRRNRPWRWSTPRSGRRQAPGHDLGHLVRAHALGRHPVQGCRTRPIPRKPICRNRSRARPRIRSADALAGRVRSAKPNSMSPVSAWASKWITDTRPHRLARHPGHVRPGDGVIAAEHERNRPGTCHLLDHGFQGRTGRGGIAGYISTSPASRLQVNSPSVRIAQDWAGTPSGAR